MLRLLAMFKIITIIIIINSLQIILSIIGLLLSQCSIINKIWSLIGSTQIAWTLSECVCVDVCVCVCVRA